MTEAHEEFADPFNCWCEVQTQLHKQYSILIYIQQDATLHSLFYLETALHVSGGTSRHRQERKQFYLQHLVFAFLMMSEGTTLNM